MTEGLPNDSLHKKEFEAMRLASQHPELVEQIVADMTQGIPVEGVIPRKKEPLTPPPAKLKSRFTEWQDENQ